MYYQDRHICVRCRKELTSKDKNPAIVFLDENQKIQCYEIIYKNEKKVIFSIRFIDL